MQYIDIYKYEGDKEVLVSRDVMMPVVIDSSKVGTIQPYFGVNGKTFKNVSYINYDNKMLKVYGNYKQLSESIKNDSSLSRIKVKGFKRYMDG